MKAVKPFLQVCNRHLYEVGNAHPIDFYIGCFFLETCAVAIRTYRFATIAAHQYAVLYFVLILFHHLEKVVDTYTFMLVTMFVGGQTMPKHVFLFLCELVIGFEYRKVVGCCTPTKFIFPYA